MIRRDFLAALALGTGAVFAPRFGRWHRQGSGLWVRDVFIAVPVLQEGRAIEVGEPLELTLPRIDFVRVRKADWDLYNQVGTIPPPLIPYWTPS